MRDGYFDCGDSFTSTYMSKLIKMYIYQLCLRKEGSWLMTVVRELVSD